MDRGTTASPIHSVERKGAMTPNDDNSNVHYTTFQPKTNMMGNTLSNIRERMKTS